MTEIKSEETQQELFWEFSRESKKEDRFPSLQRTQKPILISTHIEQIILVSIILILVACLIFFLGVVRGKAISGNSPRPVVSRLVVQNQPLARPQNSAPPVQKPVVQKQTPDITKPYTIQVITFKNQDLAEKEAAELRKSGYFSFIVPSAAYFQVFVGRYSSKEDAKKDLKVLGGRYKDCFLTRKKMPKEI